MELLKCRKNDNFKNLQNSREFLPGISETADSRDFAVIPGGPSVESDFQKESCMCVMKTFKIFLLSK